MMFDQQHLGRIRKSALDCIRTCIRRAPKKDFDKLRRWAGQGSWLAIESHPEILDSDGVPGLDLVVRSKPRGSVVRPPAAPKSGIWHEPATGFLDLPTGELIVAYEPEFFDPGYLSECPTFDATDRESQQFENRDFIGASSFLLQLKPGFYLVHTFTRDFWADSDRPVTSADLAVYLTPVTKPDSFNMSEPVLPYRVPDPKPKPQSVTVASDASREKPPKPKLLTDHSFSAHFLACFADGGGMDLPRKVRDKLKLRAGLVATLEFAGLSVKGLIASSRYPRPEEWQSYNSALREHGELATLEIRNEALIVKLPPAMLPKVANGSFLATLTVVRDDDQKPIRIKPGG